MNLKLIKCHGSGNDFLLIDEMEDKYKLDDKKRRELAITLCNRDSSLGADGILYILDSEECVAQMRIFNPDGSEASMCGNGLRCAGRYVCEKFGLEEAIIETMKANLKVEKHEEIFPEIPTYKVEISPVSFNVKDLPFNWGRETLIQDRIPVLSNDISFTAVAVPNPHLIAIVDTELLSSNQQEQISLKVNQVNELFPDGVNVSFVRLLDKGNIYVRTFERGVGFTNACGTAMSASTLVTCMIESNDLNVPINVYNNGGMVQCIVHQQEGQYKIDLIGNATYIYSSEMEINFEEKGLIVNLVDQEDYSEEDIYSQLQKFAQEYLTENR